MSNIKRHKVKQSMQKSESRPKPTIKARVKGKFIDAEKVHVSINNQDGNKCCVIRKATSSKGEDDEPIIIVQPHTPYMQNPISHVIESKQAAKEQIDEKPLKKYNENSK